MAWQDQLGRWARQLAQNGVTLDQAAAMLKNSGFWPDEPEAKTREGAGRAAGFWSSDEPSAKRASDDPSANRAGGVADVGSAKVDLDRQRRCGFPEAIYGPGKTVEAIEAVARALLDAGQDVLATRVSTEQAEVLLQRFPTSRYNAVGKIFRIPRPGGHEAADLKTGYVAVLTAGTGDLPVAEEARETALWTGCRAELIVDVGVAGPQRLQQALPKLESADAVVVVAGMEGALPSMVAGYVSCPVIAVPTSIGYGASFGGVSALLSMLNSCAANVAVVNIDAGFKGGYLAGMIATKRKA